jgi:hypothetical protein
MTVRVEVRMRWKEQVMVYSKILFHNMPGQTSENYKKPQKKLPLGQELDSGPPEYFTSR